MAFIKSKMNKKILIVDDEVDILEFLGYNLRNEGFEVETAINGARALDLLEEEYSPDLVILDIMMPGMDGVELCRRIRKMDEFKNVLIAFLTARNEDYTQIAALDSGGDDFITKPIKPSVLVSRVKALLRRSGSGDNNSLDKLKFGNLLLDKERMIVNISGREIELAKKEFELFSLLTSKPGKVFGREEILSKVWGSEVIVVNRTIDVHIRKLREKIGNNYIKTIKGVGYKFDY